VTFAGFFAGTTSGRHRSLADRVIQIYRKYWPTKPISQIPFASATPVDALLMSGLMVLFIFHLILFINPGISRRSEPAFTNAGTAPGDSEELILLQQRS
jgi:hypothetical protein